MANAIPTPIPLISTSEHTSLLNSFTAISDYTATSPIRAERIILASLRPPPLHCCERLALGFRGFLTAIYYRFVDPMHDAFINFIKEDTINIESLYTFLRGWTTPDITDEFNMTPLLWAAKKVHLSAIATLLAYGANINHINHHGLNALLLVVKAVINRPEKIPDALCAITLLCSKHIDKELIDRNGNTALMCAVDSEYNYELCSVLIRRGCNINATNRKGENPFSMICKKAFERASFVSSLSSTAFETLRRKQELEDYLHNKNLHLDEIPECHSRTLQELYGMNNLKTIMLLLYQRVEIKEDFFAAEKVDLTLIQYIKYISRRNLLHCLVNNKLS